MAITPINNAQLVIVGTTLGMDVSGHFDEVSEVPGSVTVRQYAVGGGGGFLRTAAGIRQGGWQINGFCDAAAGGTLETFTSATLGQTCGIGQAIPSSGFTVAEGDLATLGSGILADYTPARLPVDDLGRMSMTYQSTSGFARGVVGAPLAARTSTFTGSGVAMTGPTATQRMWCLLLVTSAGTSLACKLQSDTAGFGSPTDRITFSTVSAAGWQLGSVAGDLSTETHWRITATIGAGTFNYMAIFGVA
jgi:hypothetical protein